MNLYPAIDLLDGKCVRLKQGRFDESTAYSADPLAVARRFESEGARFLHVVDLSGAKDPARLQESLLRKLLGATKLKAQVGGGIRSAEYALRLIDHGADRVVIGSAAVSNPELVQDLLAEVGGAHVTVALDVRMNESGEACVALRGWQDQTSVTIAEAVAPFVTMGLERVLCTDIDRDGMMTGPNVELYARLARQFPAVEFQASGGVGKLDDLLALKAAGVRSAVVGKALYEGAIKLPEAIARC